MKVKQIKGVFLGGVVFVCLCGNALAVWSSPELVSELNASESERAAYPCLSRDGLTMYFSRYDAGSGYWRLVEAYRDAPERAFTSERMLSELVATGYDLTNPWISSDRLQLYYTERDDAGSGKIKMAQRASTDDTWTSARVFDELHQNGADAKSPSLTEDELTIVFASTRLGSIGGIDLWMASRTSADGVFGNIRPLYEINTDDGDGWPCIMPDGLTLYFISVNRGSDEFQNLYRATRSSLITTFENVQRVNIPVPSPEILPHANYVTPDEKTVYFNIGGGNIYVSQWFEKIGIFHVDAIKGDDGNDGLTRDSAFATIQAAIDMSADDSTVLVWPGVYNEQVDFKGKAITVRSAADAAVVQTDTGYAFSFHSGEGAGSVLKNFVISESEYGIFLTNGSSPTISNLTIVDNDYGINANDGAAPDISNCIFWNNTYGDLDGCEAIYSCVQDGSPGEGNIDTYPLFADPANSNYHLLSERGRYVPVDPTLPPWTEPVHVAELDDAQSNKAFAPSLSSDGLSMYLSRYIPSLGLGCIVEATRTMPVGEFTSERVLAELVGESDGVDAPWISQDGLRLYYRDLISGVTKIRMAERPSTSDAWTPVRTFEELHIDDANGTQPALTADELEIFFHSTRPGGIGGVDLWTATRTSTEEPFGNIRPLYEINTTGGDAGPHVSPDGLTLYFTSDNREGFPPGQLFKSTRSSRNATFKNVQYMEFNNNLWAKDNCYVVPDEKALYYVGFGGGIYMSELIEDQWVLDGASSPCVDAGNPVINPADERMPNGARLNVGAYGRTGSASMSVWPVKGDINRNGVVNLADFVILANDWLNSLPWFGE